MIRFFSKIRNELINKKRLGRYSIYALGEIFLVVLGILIALQINNWNETRKQNNMNKHYMTSLYQDLSDNLNHINSRHEIIEDRLTKKGNIQNRLKQPEANIDSVVNIAKNDVNFIIATFSYFNSNTYQSLQNTGNIQYFPVWIQEELQQIKFLEEELINVSRESRESLDKLIFEYMQTVPHNSLRRNYSSQITDLAWDTVDKVSLFKQLDAIFWLEGAMYASVKRRSIPLEEKYQWFIDSLKIEYPFVNQ